MWDADLDGQFKFDEHREVFVVDESEQTSQPKKISKTNLTDSSDNAFDTNYRHISGLSLIDPRWEFIDPTPDIRALFVEFNKSYFWSTLEGVEVRWSPRMTLCAGICHYEGRGGLCSIRLSVPLLKLRPRKDLIETLLHEMIHAYLFVTDNDRDHDGHGPQFQKHMRRLNRLTGTHITIYHDFHDEVEHYQQHWWRCSGPCRNRKPYYGFVKRAMNRAPSSRDPWWSDHARSCNGAFIKIKEPPDYKSGKSKKTSSDTGKKTGKIMDLPTMWKNILEKGETSADKENQHKTSNRDSTSTAADVFSSDVVSDEELLAAVTDADINDVPSASAISRLSVKDAGRIVGGNDKTNNQTSDRPLVRYIPGIGTIRSERPISSSKAAPGNSVGESLQITDCRSEEPSEVSVHSRVMNDVSGIDCLSETVTARGFRTVSQDDIQATTVDDSNPLKRLQLHNRETEYAGTVAIPKKKVHIQESDIPQSATELLTRSTVDNEVKLSDWTTVDAERRQNDSISSCIELYDESDICDRGVISGLTSTASSSLQEHCFLSHSELLTCPCCQKSVLASIINEHLDNCLL